MLLLNIGLYAQTSVKGPLVQNQNVLHSTMYGVGTSNVMDSYLSPYDYKGIDVRLIRETMRGTKLWDGHVVYQTLLDIDGGYLTNFSKTAHDWAGGIRYSNSWMYRWTFDSDMEKVPLIGETLGVYPNVPGFLNIYAGLQPSAYLGGIYNTRNGNNPAQAKLDVTINATAMAQYNLHLFKHVFPIRYQITVPLIGVAFSMNYGQSYYEAFKLGDYDHNVVFAHPANMPSMRHLLTLDIPVRRYYIRLGWSGEFNQSKFNGIRYHSYSNNFMIGFAKYFMRLP